MSPHGGFSADPPETRWLTEVGPDRNMQVLKEFWFRDPAGTIWTTPAGWNVDGASIPRALWTLVGSPYTGDYRRASIVHDKACGDANGDAKARRAADRMFYHACRAGGCSIFEGTLLYIGVRIGALTPLVEAWKSGPAPGMTGPRIARTRHEDRIESDFQATADQVLRQGETDDVDELERRTDRALETITSIPIRRG
ncbi:MAG: DUF1353 domain-containing protein [Steroidobacteraceae bacterium]